MVTIAMTREMGTFGKDVAQGLADSLDLKVIHSELVEHDLAERLCVQESAVHHYLEGNASLLERWKIDKSKLSQYTAEEILEFAQAGNVNIRGLGGSRSATSHCTCALSAGVCPDAVPRTRHHGSTGPQGCRCGAQRD